MTNRASSISARRDSEWRKAAARQDRLDRPPRSAGGRISPRSPYTARLATITSTDHISSGGQSGSQTARARGSNLSSRRRRQKSKNSLRQKSIHVVKSIYGQTLVSPRPKRASMHSPRNSPRNSMHSPRINEGEVGETSTAADELSPTAAGAAESDAKPPATRRTPKRNPRRITADKVQPVMTAQDPKLESDIGRNNKPNTPTKPVVAEPAPAETQEQPASQAEAQPEVKPKKRKTVKPKAFEAAERPHACTADDCTERFWTSAKKREHMIAKHNQDPEEPPEQPKAKARPKSTRKRLHAKPVTPQPTTPSAPETRTVSAASRRQSNQAAAKESRRQTKKTKKNRRTTIHDKNGNLPSYLRPTAASVRHETQTVKDPIREAWEFMDVDGDGELTAEEIRKCMLELGFPLENIEELIVFADEDGNGNISFDEFRDAIMRSQEEAKSRRMSGHTARSRRQSRHASRHASRPQSSQEYSAEGDDKIAEAFRFYDENRVGELSIAALCNVLLMLGCDPEEYKSDMVASDVNSDGVLSFAEFREFCKSVQELEDAFASSTEIECLEEHLLQMKDLQDDQETKLCQIEMKQRKKKRLSTHQTGIGSEKATRIADKFAAKDEEIAHIEAEVQQRFIDIRILEQNVESLKSRLHRKNSIANPEEVQRILDQQQSPSAPLFAPPEEDELSE